MNKILFFALLVCCFSCSSKKKLRNKNIEIVIEYSQSYKYDFKRETYTVFFWPNKPPQKITFHLTETEKTSIVDKYYGLGIDEIIKLDSASGTIFFEDECMTMPKLFTILTVNNGEVTQKIKIDEECDDFFFSNNRKANDVKELLDFIWKMIRAKPEIKNAPLSDIMYI